jgi:hypothetical protein
LVAQAWSPSVSCEQETLPPGSGWKHRPFQGLDHLEHLDLFGPASQPVAAVGAALAFDQARLAQLGDQMLEVGEGEALGIGDGAQRHRCSAVLTAQLDHQANPVLGSGGKQHRINPS